MVPIAPAVVAVLWLIRSLSGNPRWQRQTSAWVFLKVLIAAVWMGSLAAVLRATHSSLVLVAWFVVGTCYLFPFLVVRFLVIPRGSAKVSYYVGRALLSFGWTSEMRAGAALYAAITLARKEVPTDAEAWWVEEKLRASERRPSWRKPVPKRGAWVAAWGFLFSVQATLAERAKDATKAIELRTRARTLLSSVELLPWHACPWIARRWARLWIMADDAGVGDWESVATRRRLAVPLSRRAWLLRELAYAKVVRPRPWLLKFFWALAPARADTRAWVDWAVSEPTSRGAAADSEDPLAVALTHLRDASRGAGALSVHELMTSWDRAFASGDWHDAHRMAFIDDIVQELAEIMIRARASAAPGNGGELSERVFWRVRERLVPEFETALQSLMTRADADDDELGAVDEWLAFNRTRELHAQIARMLGSSVAAALWDDVVFKACHVACWYCNRREPRELGLAYIGFRWLRSEARAQRDKKNEKLMASNMTIVWAGA